MKILIYFGHPAQYLFFREIIRRLKILDHEILILIKEKDVLAVLLDNDGFEYINILPKERGKSRFSIVLSFFKRHLKILPVILKYKPDLLIGGDPAILELGWLLGIKRFTLTEDDYSVIKKLSWLSYPFSQTIVCPLPTDTGRWNRKKIGYHGYMKLSYLHPNVFTTDKNIPDSYNIRGEYAIIRLARLTAHHDFGIKGLSGKTLDKIIDTLKAIGITVYISSESDIDKKYEPYLLKIKSSEFHHILAFSKIFISDSQSMSVEAAMLGIPSIRYSDFAGRISVLEELEYKYQLTFGIKPGEDTKLFSTLSEIINTPELDKVFKNRKEKMLRDKIDVAAFFVWFIDKYPESIDIMQKSPDFQFQFK